MPPEPKERLPVKITPDPITLFMAEVRFGLFAFGAEDMAKPIDAQALAAKLKEIGCEQIEVEKVGTGIISAPYDRNVELSRKEPAHLRAQLGPNIISLMIEEEPYPGWEVVSGQIREWLKIILETGI